MRFVTVFAALALIADPQSAQQAQQQVQQPTQQQLKESEACSIEGMVVKAADSQPLKKARVFLRRAEGGPGGVRQRQQPIVGVSDAEGRFSLREIPPGRYRLFVERNGYVRQEYGQRTSSGQGSILSLLPGQRMRDVLFRLLPAAVIAGRLYDSDGEPASWVHVQAMRYSYFRGQRQLTPAGSATSNDLGEYRIFGLPPGRYYLSGTPARGMTMLGPTSFSITRDGSEDEQEYIATYYPGRANPAEAVPIEIKAGEELSGMDFALILQRTVRVRGRVFNTVAGSSRRETMVMLVPRTTAGFFPFFRERDVAQEDGSFELRGVAPGSYNLMATAFSEGRAYSARQPIEVGQADLDGVSVVIAPGADIAGQLRVEGNLNVQEADVRVFLRPAEEQQMYFDFGGGSGTVGADGTFTLKNVAPGPYRVMVGGLPPDAYLKAARLSEEDVLERGMNVGPGKTSATLEVTVSTAGARVEGLVLNPESLPVSGVVVALVPEQAKRQRNELFKTTTTDQYGRFQLRGIAPGDYKVFAWEEVEQGAWFDPEFLNPIESKGKEVRLAEGELRAAELKALPAR